MKRTMPVVQIVISLALAWAACGASAQPKPALVQDRDEPGRDPYVVAIHQASTGFCNIAACVFNFAAVPAGKRVVITHVAVGVPLAAGTSQAAAYLLRSDGVVMPLPAAQRVRPNRYVVSTPITFFVDAGQAPSIEFQYDEIDAGGFVYATLSGYFVTLP